MRYHLTCVVCRIDETLLSKFHVFGLIITRKSNVVCSYVERHAVTNISLYPGTVTDTSFDVGGQAGHSCMIASIPHAHRIVLPVWHAYRHLAIALILIMHLIL